MCGTEFCNTCHDEHVETWAVGARHDMPKFGDNAQERVAKSKRTKVFFETLKRNLEDAMIFPEGPALVLDARKTPNSALWARLAKSNDEFSAFTQEPHVARHFTNGGNDRQTRRKQLREFLKHGGDFARTALFAQRFGYSYERLARSLEPISVPLALAA